MRVEICRRERLKNGWSRWIGAVERTRVEVRMMDERLLNITASELQPYVIEGLKSEYLRQYRPDAAVSDEDPYA